MNAQVIAFLEQVSQNPDLHARVEAAASESGCAGDVVDIAAGAGYQISIEELLAACEQIKAAQASRDTDGVLSDERLDGVSAGGSSFLSSFDGKNLPMLGSIASSLTCCGECIEEHEARRSAAQAA